MNAHLSEAQEILRLLGLPTEQTNERAALTLLGLLSLTPDQPWSQSQNPLIGITPIMSFMAAHYLDQPYAANTRETVRRYTMHQFVAAGVVVPNPDEPNRPINSPKFCYQVPAQLLNVLRTYGTDEWAESLAHWSSIAQSLRERWASERAMALIAVTLPDGQEIGLTPGGQNLLIAKILEDFCPRYTPGGSVLYLGDAGAGDPIFDREAFEREGIELHKHGKMPDLVVLLPERKWLVLIEAVTSHGPISALRKDDLARLFSCHLGLVFVTTFPDMATFVRYARDVAWETDVWIAENPTHLIHFNGERFLGPYDG
jgi:type II restriction enzyme